MAIIKVSLFLLLVICSNVSADSSDNKSTELSNPAPTEEAPSLVGSITTVIVEWISRGVSYLFELFDLKMRTLRFIASLYTDDNLKLLKSYMNISLRFGTWLYNLVPESTAEGGVRLLSFLFPQQNQPAADTHEIPPTTATPAQIARENEVFVVDKDTQEQLVTLQKLINSRSSYNQN